jgi:citronellol/citronellal dehydrogenase
MPGPAIQELLFTDDELDTRKTSFATDALAGRVAVITGGASGMGRATAWLFARLGASVVVCSRNVDKLNRIDKALKLRNKPIEVFEGNIRQPEMAEKLFRFTEDRFGQFDILINSAGGQYPQPAIDFTPKGWNAVIDTNLNGTWYMMQGAARYWRARQRPGIIVNIVASVPRGMPGGAHTCAARAGVIYLSKTVAVEWAPDNIRINCIAPGTIATEGMLRYDDDIRETFASENPMRRVGNAWDIAEAAAYLGSQSGGYITGEVLTIDGGAQMWGDLWTIPKPEYFTANR